jgi:hypothetical protein
MRRRLGLGFLFVFGSFFVYCAQNVVGDMRSGGNGGGGGMIGNAGADTCCTPPDPAAGTVLFDQKFTQTADGGSCVSPAINVGGNRTIVVHGANAAQVQWTFGGAAGWSAQTGADSNYSTVSVADGRLGKQLRIYYGSLYSSPAYPCTAQMALTVVGYKQ